MASPVETSTLRKLNTRLILFLFILYFFSWIDRANVGIAALRMNQDLKFSATVYGLGAGLFFLSYALFEIPSNLIMNRVGARLWLARIMVTWGIISSCFIFVHGQTSFYVLRFLLGAAEAGFVPGVVFYLTFWFPPEYRAKSYARFLSAAMLALVTMGPISGWLMTTMNGLAGLAGWRWMFLLEGAPSVILGIVTVFYLKDRPKDAAWLTAEEKAWLTSALEEGRRNAPPKEHHSVSAFVSDPRLWALTITYFFWTLGGYGIMFWLPTILKSVGHLSATQIGLLFSLPFICAFLGMYVIAPHSDRTGERKFHMVVSMLVATVFLGASVYVPPVLALIFICIASFAIWGMQPIFWTLPPAYLGGASGAAGIALINSFGGIGGFAGPSVVGWIKDLTGRFSLAVLAMALSFLVTACMIAALKVQRTGGTAPSGATQKEQMSAGAGRP
ncbi:MAG: MFS transporter [Candidatus Korobacteraceae bacterium]|jgi:D-galactonate transporter